jgi:hypothetical protein
MLVQVILYNWIRNPFVCEANRGFEPFLGCHSRFFEDGASQESQPEASYIIARDDRPLTVARRLVQIIFPPILNTYVRRTRTRVPASQRLHAGVEARMVFRYSGLLYQERSLFGLG